MATETLTLKHAYTDKDTARYSFSVEGDSNGKKLKMAATLVQAARIPKSGEPNLKIVIDKVSIKVNGKVDSINGKPELLFRIDRTGRVLGGWIPEQKTAIGMAFLPYLLYGRTYELGKGQSFSYSDPNVRGFTVNGTATWIRKETSHLFRAIAQIRGAMDRGRPTMVSIECSFDAKDNRLLTSEGSFSTTLQAASPEVNRRPKMNGLEFKLVRL